MSLMDSLRALFGRTSVTRIYSVRAASVLGMGPTELYRKQPALRAVVSFIADNVADIPLKCYVRKADDDRPRDTESPLALMLARPSRSVTAFELKRAIVSDFLLYDHALGILIPDQTLPSGWQLRHVPWSWIDADETDDGFEPSRFVVVNPYTGGRAEFDATDCVHFYNYDPMGIMGGGSPIDALREVLSEQISAWGFRNSVWRNGGRVTQFLTRPATAAQWEPKDRTRFAKSWKERFAGEGGTDTGGTPLLEDGMELKSVTFNAREAEWAEATRLSRSDVAAVYHVSPALIWHDGTQTYASAKDNARALYSEALSPILTMVQERLNAQVAARPGMAPEGAYCEFDISSKLAASFEEQAGVLQSSAGGPWITRNEARARMNLPALPGADELIVPLNVTEGGLASPNDTDPTKGAPVPAPVTADQLTKALAGAIALAAMQLEERRAKALPGGGGAAPFGEGVGVVLLKTSSEPPEDLVAEIADALASFLGRQARRVLRDVEAAGDDWDKAAGVVMRKDGAGESFPSWWDALRWDRELADDLEPIFRRLCDLRGVGALADIGEAASLWDSRRTANFMRAVAESRAHAFNHGTLTRIQRALLDAEGVTGRVSAAERAFLWHAENRAARGARTFATAVAAFATKEAVRQVYPRDTEKVRRTKTWRHHGSGSPRGDHAAMDGETVGLDERFSNGADYPGDLSLPAKDTVNCRCTIDVAVIKQERERMYGVRYDEAMDVDEDYIASDEYAEKYRGVTGKPDIDEVMLGAARRALRLNSGTSNETMTFVDVLTGESRTVDSDVPGGIAYTSEVREFIEQFLDGPPRLAVVHNHPNGTPPSADDLSKMSENNYAFALVAGHNGQVYSYDYHGPTLDKRLLDSIAHSIAWLCDNGYDVDRAFSQVFAENGLVYELR